MKPRAVSKHLVLKPKISKEERVGGIIVPESKVQPIAVVYSVGADVEDIIGEIKPGEKVIYREHVGTIIEFEGEQYIILDALDILSILE